MPIPEIMGRGLLWDAAMFPGLLEQPNRPAPPLQPREDPAARSPSRFGAIADVVRRVLGGADSAQLSPEQNASAGRAAALQAGLAMLASDRPGLQGIAEGAMYGQQAGGAARTAQARQERIAAVVDQMGGDVDVDGLRRLFVQAVAAGDPQAAQIGDVLKVIENRVGTAQTDSAPYMIEGEGINPSTGKAEKYLQDRRTGRVQWTGIPPVPARGQTINVNASPEGAYAKDEYGAQAKRADDAQSRLNNLSVMESLLNDGMTSGRLDELTMGWRGLAAGLGFPSENLNRQAAFKAVSNALAIRMKEGMTGPMSDRDIMFVQNQVPTLGNTVEGNRILISVMRRFAQREIELADLMDQYQSEKGTLNGWRSYKSQWLRDNPLSFADLRGEAAPWE